MDKRKKLKTLILNEMVRGIFATDREEMLLSIINEYPHLNNPKDRKKIRELYTKFRIEEENK